MGSYVPNTLEERQEMLKEIGYSSIEDLFAHIPDEVKIKGGLNIPEGKSELEVRREMENIASKNQVFKTIFRGAGAYRHFIPSIVNSVISKENLLTAYTPYQAEISQGILQSIFEYQTMICDLTGMDVSNACVPRRQQKVWQCARRESVRKPLYPQRFCRMHWQRYIRIVMEMEWRLWRFRKKTV